MLVAMNISDIYLDISSMSRNYLVSTRIPCLNIPDLVLSHYKWQRQLGIVQETEWEHGDVSEMNKFL